VRGGEAKTMNTTAITTNNGRAGLEHIGDVLSLCQVMIGMTQQIIYLFFIIQWTAAIL